MFRGVREMFWDKTEETSLDKLLKASSINLKDVLEDPYTLQELRSNNRQLVEYLTKEEILLTLVKNALEPSIDPSVPLKLQYKSAHVSTEVLTVACKDMVAAVVGNKQVMDTVFSCFSRTDMNALEASFFMRIFTHIFGRATDDMLKLVVNSTLISSCLSHMHLSAISDLLLRVLSTPSDPAHVVNTLNWLTSSGLVEGLIDLLTPQQLPVVHYNVAYLYTDMVRSIRDILYSSDDKDNVLHDKLQSEECVRKIVSKVLAVDEKGKLSASVVVNGCQMLEALLDSNFIPNRPSHQLDDDRMEAWLGGIPDNPNTLDGNEVYQADAARVCEGVMVERAEEWLRQAIALLAPQGGEGGVEGEGDTWCAVMEMILQLHDTNSIHTHSHLHAAYKKHPLKHLIQAAISHPNYSVLHQQVYKIIRFILHSACSPESPLIVYLFQDVDVIGFLLHSLHHSLTAYTPREQGNVRAFILEIGAALETARTTAPNKEHLDGILKSNAKWGDLWKEVSVYAEGNKSANVEPTIPSLCSSRNNASLDVEFTPAQASSQLAHSTLHEFESRAPSQLLPSHLDDPLAVISPIDMHSYSVEAGVDVELCSVMEAHDADESAFERQCTLRAANGDDEHVDDDWPRAPLNSHSDTTRDLTAEWPGESGSWSKGGGGGGQKEKEGGASDAQWPSASSPIEWDSNHIKGQQLTDDWPCANSSSSMEGGGKGEVWADFESANLSSSSLSPSASSAWGPSNDPAALGFASSLLSSKPAPISPSPSE